MELSGSGPTSSWERRVITGASDRRATRRTACHARRVAVAGQGGRMESRETALGWQAILYEFEHVSDDA